ncbi:tyrosine--tRNA ligase, partial [Achromatium sp. WMS1]
MSKSLNNYIGITEPALSMYGKIMSISDDLMWRYYELLSTCSLHDLAKFKLQVTEGRNPRDIKMALAQELVTRFHGAQAATHAAFAFISQFQRGEIPEEMPQLKLAAFEGNSLPIGNLLKNADLVTSTSEALRMIKQGAVRIDGERIMDSKLLIQVGTTHVYQVGKRRFARVSVMPRTNV